MADSERSMVQGPLTGVRVVALEQAIAMPFCSWVLAEMGADVVKIERRGRGDVVRGWDSAVRGLSTGYAWVNANKRDVTIDLARDDGREIVRRLVADADVFVENFAPGVVGRMGLADSDLRPSNRRLVYAGLSGYGQTGPARDVKAYDLLVQGEAGVLMTNGYPDAPAKVGLPIADLVGGVTAGLGILAALYERESTGEGRYLDVSMFDAMLNWLGYFPHYQWHTGSVPERSGMRHQFVCPYGPYMASDGQYVNLVVAEDGHWRLFCEEVVHRPEWLTDQRFTTVRDRHTHRSDLEPLVEGVIASEPSEVWIARLRAARLPYGKVRGVAEALEHPNTAAHGLVIDATSPVGSIPLVRFCLAGEGERHVPDLGEHTDAVLAEAGYSADEIVRLHADEVV